MIVSIIVFIIYDLPAPPNPIIRGCTGEISKKKIFSKPFFSQCNLADMVCRMNIHQDGF
jgi:hypothetical protein